MTDTPSPTALRHCLELLASLPDDELAPCHEYGIISGGAEYTRQNLQELLSTEDANAKDEEGYSALFEARHSPRLVEALLAAGTSPQACGEEEVQNLLDLSTPLETLALLLAAGLNPNVATDGGDPPLHLACEADDVPRVRLLLAHGANPHAQWWDERTPLFYARSAEVAELLIAAGADPNEQDLDTCRPLHSANAAVTRVLLAHGADVQATHLFGVTALALTEDEEKIRLLRAAGARLIPADVAHAATSLFPNNKSGRLEEWLRLRGGRMSDVAPAIRQETERLARRLHP